MTESKFNTLKSIDSFLNSRNRYSLINKPTFDGFIHRDNFENIDSND